MCYKNYNIRGSKRTEAQVSKFIFSVTHPVIYLYILLFIWLFNHNRDAFWVFLSSPSHNFIAMGFIPSKVQRWFKRFKSSYHKYIV